MLVIGLTGGIGSGKSTVAQLLGKLGAVVVDSDSAAHETYRPQSTGWHKLVAAFGPSIVNADGSIDRKSLGAIVFSDPAALATLNAIVHPLVRALLVERIEASRKAGAPAIVVEVPLLIETGFDKLVDQIWVTTAPEDVMIRRLATRSGLSQEEARKRIELQLKNAERLKRAHVVIDTDVDIQELERRVRTLWEQHRAVKGRA